jgi:hypothetical protein
VVGKREGITRSSGLPGLSVQWPVLPSQPPRCPSAQQCVWSNEGESRVVVQNLILTHEAQAPRKVPGPPESAINSNLLTRVANSDSMISIGAIFGVGLIDVGPDTPSFPLRPRRRRIFHIAHNLPVLLLRANDDRAAAAAVADFFMRCNLA